MSLRAIHPTRCPIVEQPEGKGEPIGHDCELELRQLFLGFGTSLGD
jgi:hypothetical protein